MAGSEIALYKKEKRRENRSRVRQALFVSDYVFYKHFAIYQEAAQLYNQINHIYPRKPDLRRTVEFRAWRNGVTGQSSTGINRRPTVNQQTYVFPAHADIPVAESIDPGHSFTVVVQPESQRPESPRSETPRAESPQPERPRAESLVHPNKGEKVMELKIPLMNPPTETHPLVTQEVLQKDNPEPSIYTETLQTVTDEVLQEGALEPSLHEEISPEVIEKIMAELRQDPGLKDIMTSVEEQLELEQVGLEIDISVDDRLEAELENMIFW